MTGGPACRAFRAARGRLWLIPVLALLPVWACGGPAADNADMRVDQEAAMDTTPAGTPAPPSLSTLQQEQRRQTTVTLGEWNLAIAQDALPSGEITFQAVNTGSLPHALAIDGLETSEGTDPIDPGETGSLTVYLTPGTYRLLCPDSAAGDPHASRGMSAPLVIR